MALLIAGAAAMLSSIVIVIFLMERGIVPTRELSATKYQTPQGEFSSHNKYSCETGLLFKQGRGSISGD